MRNEAFLFLFAIIILAGCTNAASPYQNDVIIQENYVLTRANPFTDSSTTIRFNIRNVGRDVVPKTDILFTDLQGLSAGITCQDGTQIGTQKNPGCEFTNIDSLDSRYISIIIYTPSADAVKSPTSYQIIYNISFDYSGFRRLVIPVVNDPSHQPQNKYAVSNPSVGPIEVAFEPPIGAISKQGNQQTTEYWGVKGDSFEVRIDFKQAVQNAASTAISGSNIKLSLQGLNIDTKSKCDFNSGLTANFDVVVGQSQASLTCSFLPQNFNTAEMNTVIDINYAYTYSTVKTESFTVYPRGTATTSISGIPNGGSNPGSSNNPPSNNPGSNLV
jgi:hypothetical protein